MQENLFRGVNDERNRTVKLHDQSFYVGSLNELETHENSSSKFLNT